MEGNEGESVKKIVALKVPSIFIKGSASSTTTASQEPVSDNGGGGDTTPTSKTVKRPMPLSAKRKQAEESKAKSSSSSTDTPDASFKAESCSSSESGVQKKKSFAMPASVRRKLEEAAAKLNECPSGTDADTLENASEAHADVKIQSSKPEEATDNGASIDETDISCPRPDSNPTKTTVAKTVKKAMPASIRRKFEEKSQETRESDSNVDVAARDDSDNGDAEECPKPISTVPTETKKISISMAGLSFPKFKSSVSTSRKVEEHSTITSSPEKTCDTTTAENENSELESTEEATETGRSRRSVTKLVSASVPTLAKFFCQYCDKEFLSLSGKNKHEHLVHLNKTDNDQTPAKPTKPKPTREERSCPTCQRFISNSKKLKKHIYQCSRPYKYECQYCDKKFQENGKLLGHLKSHTRQLSANTTDSYIPTSGGDIDNNDNGNSRAASPVSASSNGDGSKSSKASHVEKAKPMPLSVKAKVDREKDQSTDIKDNKYGSSSFKRKIAEVLSGLGSRYSKSSTHGNENEDRSGTDSDEGPPRKKTILSDESEDIRGRPMPNSVRKKLEKRTESEKGKVPSQKKNMSSSSSSKESEAVPAPVGDLECEFCHAVFSTMTNRRRHESTKHNVENPIGRRSGPVAAASPKTAKPNKTPPVQIKAIPKPVIEINSGSGLCPICSKFINRLPRHLRNVHKVEVQRSNSSNPVSLVSSTPVKPSAPKSYKIYKSAASKIKKKLGMAMSSKSVNFIDKANSKPAVIPIPESKPMSQIKPEINSMSSTYSCGCCEKPFEVAGKLSDHMEKRKPKMKQIISCKLCRHKFSHEDDFIIHIQFKHKELISGLDERPATTTTTQSRTTKTTTAPLTAQAQSSGKSKSSNIDKYSRKDSLTPKRSTRNSSGLAWEDHSDYVAACQKALHQRVTVRISGRERKLADNASQNYIGRSSRRTSGRTRIPTPEPEPMDTYDEPDHYDDTMEVDSDPIDEIAITSTFSQKPPSPAPHTLGLDEMPCLTCNEVFYSYEALRKHELYFHNTKTSKMCPICGVYPTRLSRHLLAHENKTVRCSCAPCRLNFENFGQLLKHNLSKHPGPDGGALSAANKSRQAMETSVNKPQQEESISEQIFSCSICGKELKNMSSARRHVTLVHSEVTGDATNFVLTSDKTTEVAQTSRTTRQSNRLEPEDVLDDTNKKLLNPVVSSKSLNQSEPFSSNTSKLRKPGPASVKAKLSSNIKAEDSVIESNLTSQPKRPMPRSVREKLSLQNNDGPTSTTTDESKPVAKPYRPGPASAKAKMAIEESVSSDSEKPKPPMPKSLREKLIGPASRTNRPGPASVKAKQPEKVDGSVASDSDSNLSVKTKRPMPKSIREKLERQNSDSSRNDSGTDESKSVGRANKPGPASAKAKFSAYDKGESTAASDSDSSLLFDAKPKRPMPKSVFAKLMKDKVESSSSKDDASQNFKSPKFNRPGPASVKAKFKNNSQHVNDDNSKNTTFEESNGRNDDDFDNNDDGPASECDNMSDKDQDDANDDIVELENETNSNNDVIQLDDDDDNDVVEIPTESEPVVPSIPTFSIADELAEHSMTLRMPSDLEHPVAPPDASAIGASQCKLCSKQFDTYDSVRRHIRRAHSEYGPEHTDNLIQQLYESTDSGRRRRSAAVRYVEDDDDDDDEEEEVIRPRGTSRRPRANDSDWSPSPVQPPVISTPRSFKTPNEIELNFACKHCGKKMDSTANVKRHVSRSHPGKSTSNAVVVLSPGEKLEAVKSTTPPTNSFSPVTWSTTSTTSTSTPSASSTAVQFKCKFCGKNMDNRKTLRWHIFRAHPEMSDRVDEGILEINRGGNEDHVQDSLGGGSGTGPEFLHTDEAEICMEDMVGVNEISISASTRIQIDQPKTVVLNRRYSEDTQEHSIKKSKPGPASRKLAPKKPASPSPSPEPVDNSPPSSPPPNKSQSDNEDNEEESVSQNQKGPAGFSYQADLSSLFPSLSNAHGGLDALDDIDGGMSLD